MVDLNPSFMKTLLFTIFLSAICFNEVSAQWQWYEFDSLPSANILALDNNHWNSQQVEVVGTDEGLSGIQIGYNLPIIGTYDSLNSILESNRITCLPHSLWMPHAQAIGTYTGLYIFYPDSNSWIHLNSSNSNLPNDTINYLLDQGLGNGGGIWAGTNGGLALINDSLEITVWNTSNSPLPSNHVNSIMYKNICPWGYWISTENGIGICTYPDSTWKVLNTSNSGLPTNDVTAIYYHGNGFLIGTRANGVADSLDAGNWNYFDSSTGLPSDSITFIGPGAWLIAGDTWIGSKGGGLIYFGSGNFIGSVNNVNGVDFQNANDASFSSNFESATAWVATNKGLLMQDFGYGIPSVSLNQFPLNAYFDGDFLTINTETNQNNLMIELYDLLGRKIEASNEESGSKTFRMKLQHLSSGVYILKVSTKEIVESLKVIKTGE